MERIVLGYLTEQLSKFIVGFHKEQVNLSFLTGKGEIRNVKLNTKIINELYISKVFPIIKVESVHVSRLNINVTSFTNIRRAPIILSVDKVTVKLVESLDYVKSEACNLNKTTYRYGISDRIGDNLTLEVNHVDVTFQPLGKFKTRRVGKWTPPSLNFVINNLRFAAVDEYGDEGTPDIVWKHNDRNDRNESRYERTFLIYKRLTFDCSAALITSHTYKKFPVLQEGQIEMLYCFKKRLRDAALLALQLDVSMLNLDIEVNSDIIPLFVHFATAFLYCIMKDRPFEDPLLSSHSDSSDSVCHFATNFSQSSSDQLLTNFDDDDDHYFDDTQIIDSSAISAQSDSLRPQKKTPLLSLRGGLQIWEKVVISFAVHHCILKAFLGHHTNGGSLQLLIKGLMLDSMLSKQNNSNCDGTIQFSLPFLSLQEKYKTTYTPLLMGGIFLKDGIRCKSLHQESTKTIFEEIHREEHFPLFDNLSIFQDSSHNFLRHSRDFIPIQAISFKSTLKLQHDAFHATADSISSAFHKTHSSMVLNEVGIDKLLIYFYSEPWIRAINFFLNTEFGGFDDRWFTGKWEKEVKNDAIRDANLKQDLSLDSFLQPFPQTSQIFEANLSVNTTARLTNLSLEIPASIQNDVFSNAIIVTIEQVMINISSALPKTFLYGRIGVGSSQFEDSSDILSFSDIAKFPNDLTDFCYLSNNDNNDSPINKKDSPINKKDSFARIQIVITSLSIDIPPFLSSPLQQQLPTKLIEPTKITMLFSFDYDVPFVENKELITQVYFSMLAQQLHINFDLELIAGASRTALFHMDTFHSNCTKSIVINEEEFKFLRSHSYPSAFSHHKLSHLHRQISSMSRNGSSMLIVSIQVPSIDLKIWSQQRTFHKSNNQSKLQLLLLSKVEVSDFELGIETFKALGENEVEKKVSNRLVLKSCFQSLNLKLSNFIEIDEEKSFLFPDASLSPIIEIGAAFDKSLKKFMEEKSDVAFAFRYEACKSAAIAFDLRRIIFHTNIPSLEQLVDSITNTLFLPALPYQDRRNEILLPKMKLESSNFFPKNTLGEYFESIYQKLNCENLQIEEESKRSTQDSFDSFSVSFIIRNLLVHTHHMDNDYGLLLNELTSFYCGLKLSNTTADGKRMILSQLARCNKNWLEKFDEKTPGLHFMLDISTNFVCKQNIKSNNSTYAFLPVTTLACWANPSCADVSFNNISALLESMEEIKGFYKGLISIKDEIRNIAEKEQRFKVLRSVTESLQLQIKWEELINSSKSIRELLVKFKSSIAAHDLRQDSFIESKEIEFHDLQTSLFHKERQRLGTLSILSTRRCGWVRFGSINLSGQRFVKTVTCHQYWLVLTQKDSLVLYNEPYMTSMIDCIDLKGARLLSLSWSNKNSVVGRGFSLVDAIGKERVFIFSKKKDHDEWLASIASVVEIPLVEQNNITTHISSVEETLSFEENDGEQSNELESEVESLVEPNVTSSAKISNFRDKVASYSNQAKNTVLEAVKSPSPQVNYDENSNRGEDEVKQQQINIREKMSSVKANVQNTIQSAKVSKLNSDLHDIQESIGTKSMTSYSNLKSSMKGKMSTFSTSSPMISASKRGNKFSSRISSFRPVMKKSVVQEQKQEPNPTLILSSNKESEEDTAEKSNEVESKIEKQKISSKENAENESFEQSEINRELEKYDNQVESNEEEMKQLPLPPTSKASTFYNSSPLTSVKQINLRDKMTHMKSSASRSMRDVVNKVTPDQNALNVLNSNTFQNSSSISRLPSVEVIQKSGRNFTAKLNESISDVKHQMKVNNLRVGDQNINLVKDMDLKTAGNVPNLADTKELMCLKVDVTPFTLIQYENSVKTEKIPTGTEQDEGSLSKQTRSNHNSSKFLVSISNVHNEGKIIEVKNVSKTFSDFLALHAKISSALALIDEYKSGKSNDELIPKTDVVLSAVLDDDDDDDDDDKQPLVGDSLQEQIRIMGNLLVLTSSCTNVDKSFTNHQSEVLMRFLNMNLSCPIPVDISILIKEFLELDDIMLDLIRCGSDVMDKAAKKPERKSENNLKPVLPADIASVLYAMESELSRSEYMSLSVMNSLLSGKEKNNEYKIKQSNSRETFMSIQETLLKAKSDRDEAHSQLIGASVLHAHLLEQERKKVERMALKMKYMSKLLSSNPNNLPPGLNLRKLENEMTQNNETELISLCRQLSSEISGRTAAELELTRLKELNKNLLEKEVQENNELITKVHKLEEELMHEKKKREVAEGELLQWKSKCKDIS